MHQIEPKMLRFVNIWARVLKGIEMVLKESKNVPLFAVLPVFLI